MTTIYLVVIFIFLVFTVVPFIMAYNERDRMNIIKLNLVEKLGRLVKRSDEVQILSGKTIRVPIDYTLNNNILLLSDKEEDILIEDLAKHIHKRGLLYRPDIEIKVKFSNKRNHPYNFMEIWMESK
jgi:hypothetical protein